DWIASEGVANTRAPITSRVGAPRSAHESCDEQGQSDSGRGRRAARAGPRLGRANAGRGADPRRGAEPRRLACSEHAAGGPRLVEAADRPEDSLPSVAEQESPRAPSRRTRARASTPQPPRPAVETALALGGS